MKTKLLLILAVLTLLLVACGKRYRTIQGPQGNTGAKGEKGDQGDTGTNGNDGQDGNDGHNAVVSMTQFSGVSGSCTNGGVTILSATDSDDSGALEVTDANLVSATVCNGTNGLDAAPTQFTPVSIIDPCGNHPSVQDEIMLKLSNGQILASFSDNASGLNTRFSLLGAGSFITSDGSYCFFSVDGSGNIYNEHY